LSCKSNLSVVRAGETRADLFEIGQEIDKGKEKLRLDNLIFSFE